MKNPTLFLSNLALGILLAGCATLGTKANLTTNVRNDSFRNVALVISKQKTSNPRVDKIVDSLLVKEIVAQFSGLKPTPRVTFLGEVEDFLRDTVLHNKVSTNYTTLLHVEIALSYNGTIGGDNGYNSWVRMQAFALPARQPLGDSKFNTQMGKTYTKRPNLYQSVHDGVTGAFGPWAKRLGQTM